MDEQEFILLHESIQVFVLALYKEDLLINSYILMSKEHQVGKLAIQTKQLHKFHLGHDCNMEADPSKVHKVRLPYSSNQQEKYVQL